jgi:hypothetical protein
MKVKVDLLTNRIRVCLVAMTLYFSQVATHSQEAKKGSERSAFLGGVAVPPVEPHRARDTLYAIGSQGHLLRAHRTVWTRCVVGSCPMLFV